MPVIAPAGIMQSLFRHLGCWTALTANGRKERGLAHCNDREQLGSEHFTSFKLIMPTPIALSGARGREECSTSTAQDMEDNRTECPPDGGYGWICVACCFAVNCFTWGVVSVGLPKTMMRSAKSSSH